MRDPSLDWDALLSLRRSLNFHIAVGGLVILVAFGILRLSFNNVESWLWLVSVLFIFWYQCVYVIRYLPENKHTQDSLLFTEFGWANEVTLIRGFFFALLAGFVFLPRSSGMLAWVPGILYLLAVSMDFMDGYLARITGKVSLLGSRLDMEWDSLGFLIGACTAIFYGQIQPGYLLLGLARFIFVYGINQRLRKGLAVYELDSSMVRRALAGTQMGFVAAVLMPVFQPVVTQTVSILFMLPSLIHFWRDWLWVSGKIGRPHQPVNWTFSRKVRFWLPLVTRAILIVLLVALIWYELRQPVPDRAALLLSSIAVPALVLGAAGRFTAFGVLLMAGFLLQASPGQMLFWMILLLGSVVMMMGTGSYSLWSPENQLIYRRAGETG